MGKIHIYLYNLGAADSIQIYEEERIWLQKLIRLNAWAIDPDTEKYLHVGINMSPKMDKHSWVTYEIYKSTEDQIKLPLIDGNKCFIPVSLFIDAKEGDTIPLSMPCLIRHRSALPSTGISVVEPIEGYVELRMQLDQLGSQFNELGPFEEALKKVTA